MMILALLLIFVSCTIAKDADSNSVTLAVALDVDTNFFKQLPKNITSLHIWHVNGTRLALPSDSRLETLCIMEAPNLNNLELHPNLHLLHLIIRYCPLASLIAPLHNLHALNILKLEHCRVSGTFNMAELLTLPNVSSFSLEGNRITEVTLLMNQVPTETPQPSALTTLNLALNQIEYFRLDVLRPFSTLQNLLLQYNRVVTLEGSAWLPALTIINSRHNSLTHADLSGCNCSVLSDVILSDNKLTHFPAFGTSSDSIKILDLGSNYLSALNLEELNRLKKLSDLLLDRNALQTLTGDDGNGSMVELPHLAHLDLSYNQIKSLQLQGWAIPSLKTLRLDQNPLRQLPDDVLRCHPILKNMACVCPDVACAWVQQNVDHIRSGLFEMSVAWGRPQQHTNHCVPVPGIGCVRCLFQSVQTDTETLDRL